MAIIDGKNCQNCHLGLSKLMLGVVKILIRGFEKMGLGIVKIDDRGNENGNT